MKSSKILYALAVLYLIYSQLPLVTEEQPQREFMLFLALNFFIVLNVFFSMLMVMGLKEKKMDTNFWDGLTSFWVICQILITIIASVYYLDAIVFIILFCSFCGIFTFVNDMKQKEK